VKKIIIITGAFRCGKKLLASLLDGHPDIFVYPVEESIYFLYNDFKNGIISETTLKNRIKQKLFTNSPKNFFKKVSKSKLNKNINNQKLNKENFYSFCLSLSALIINDKKYKYFCFFIPTAVLNLSKLNSAKFKKIYIKRDPYTSYISFLKKIKKTNENYFDQFYSVNKKKNFLYLYYRLKLSNILNYKDKKQYLIELDKLQLSPQIELKKIFSYLKIKIHKINFRPTVMGLKRKSNISTTKDNYKIQVSKKHKIKLEKFERKLIASLNFSFLDNKILKHQVLLISLFLNGFNIFFSDKKINKLKLFVLYNINLFFILSNSIFSYFYFEQTYLGIKKDRLIKNLISQTNIFYK